MKKVLISYQGWVSQIVEPGEEYEIYEGPDATIAWVDAPDEITLDWTLEWSPNQETMIWVDRDAPYTDNVVARKVAYGRLEEQLDLIYHDIEQNGALTADGEWYKHVSTIKSIIPKPTAQTAEVLTGEALMKVNHTTEPSIDQPSRPSSMEMPAWKRFPGWKGYQNS